MTTSRTSRPSAKRARVPNSVRSAATRDKLLNSAIECLHELGYHQTSTVLVAERAGVSRGAMLHHFRSKADLMMAVFQRVVEMRGDLHQTRLAGISEPRTRFMKLVDVLWESMLSPSGIARIELMLSSRSDPELAGPFRELNDELDRRHKDLIWARVVEMGVEDLRARRRIDAFTQLYAAALRGLAIDALRPGSRKGARDAVQLLKEFQEQLIDELLSRRST